MVAVAEYVTRGIHSSVHFVSNVVCSCVNYFHGRVDNRDTFLSQTISMFQISTANQLVDVEIRSSSNSDYIEILVGSAMCSFMVIVRADEHEVIHSH